MRFKQKRSAKKRTVTTVRFDFLISCVHYLGFGLREPSVEVHSAMAKVGHRAFRIELFQFVYTRDQ